MGKRNKKQRNPEQDELSLRAGDRLRMARESRDLSIEDVAARLKLDVGKISALEQGDITGFAAPVFAVGYLRTYARLMGLSEEEVLADFTELASVHEQVIDPVSAVNNETYGKMAGEIPSRFSMRDKPSGNYWGMAGFAGVVVLGLLYFLWPASESDHTGVTSPQTSITLAEQTVKKAVPVPDIVTAEEEEREVASDAPPAVDIKTPVFGLEKDPQAVVTPELSAEPLETGLNSELILIFNSDSWAEVQDVRGQRLMYRLGKAGTQRVVTGIAPFVVQLGYVQGVDILYNGAAYDLSKYAHRRSVRLRIGTADEGMGGE